MNFSLDSSNLNIAVVQTGGRKTDPIFVHYSSPGFQIWFRMILFVLSLIRFVSGIRCFPLDLSSLPSSGMFLSFLLFDKTGQKHCVEERNLRIVYIYITYDIYWVQEREIRYYCNPDCLLHHPVSLAFRQCSTQSPVVATLNVPYDLPVLFPSRGENEASVSQSTAQHHLAVHELLTCYLC